MVRLPEPRNVPFSTLIDEIRKGQIKIPQFQRDFIWEIQKSAGLIDSIIKGYPIGTFILWKTNERLRSVKNLGNQQLPEPKEGEYLYYVLDGQQRLTSIYACLEGISVKRENGKEDDFSKVFINLDKEEHEQIVTTELGSEESKSIRVVDLLTGDLSVLAEYPREFYGKIELYKKSIENFQYPIVQVNDTPIEIATEIFTRINVGGKSLSSFEIMVAKTFDYEKDFDLSEKYQQLIDELEGSKYETISDSSVLQVVSMILKGECKKGVILQLDKDKFIETWDKAVDAIKSAVDYFRSYFRIPVSSLLPYNALIVPFAYFFFKHEDKPTGDKQQYLQDFFWRCSLSGRYSSALESKLAQDIKKIDCILSDERPSYDWPINPSADYIIRNGQFSAGRSYIKAILCIYAYHQPKSFSSDALINIDNSWLKRANSKNYHHFFPKAYLKNKSDDSKINHILNITIVDDYLNKREIKAKPPSHYMKKFNETNPNLSDTMKTHLIDDLDSFGIWDDDYDTFFHNRAKQISEELKKRIILQDIDAKSQFDLEDDYEEEGTVAE